MPRSRTPFGFTLVETIITIGIMSVLAGLTLSDGIGSYARGTARTDRDTVLSALREARSMALHGVCTPTACAAPAAHGIHLATSSVTLFEGLSYAARYASADESIALSGTRSITGSTDVVFTAGTGDATENESFSVTGSDGRVQAVTINALGAIDSTLGLIASTTL